MAGLADWRGHALPVVDIGCFFDSNSPAAKARPTPRYVIARGVRTGDLFALPAGDLLGIPLPLKNPGQPLSNNNPYLSAAFDVTGGTLLIPDLDRISARAGHFSLDAGTALDVVAGGQFLPDLDRILARV